MPPCSAAGSKESPSSCSVTSAAEPAQLGGKRGQPVGLVAADVRDATQARRGVGERAQRGDRGRELADVVQVGVDAQDGVRAVHGEAARVQGHLGAHPRRAGRAGRRPAWVVRRGQSGTRTRPPLVIASITNGAALDRSGSMVTSVARIGPGGTVQVSAPGLDLDAVHAQARDGHLDVG